MITFDASQTVVSPFFNVLVRVIVFVAMLHSDHSLLSYWHSSFAVDETGKETFQITDAHYLAHKSNTRVNVLSSIININKSASSPRDEEG